MINIRKNHFFFLAIPLIMLLFNCNNESDNKNERKNAIHSIKSELDINDLHKIFPLLEIDTFTLSPIKYSYDSINTGYKADTLSPLYGHLIDSAKTSFYHAMFAKLFAQSGIDAIGSNADCYGLGRMDMGSQFEIYLIRWGLDDDRIQGWIFKKDDKKFIDTVLLTKHYGDIGGAYSLSSWLIKNNNELSLVNYEHVENWINKQDVQDFKKKHLNPQCKYLNEPSLCKDCLVCNGENVKSYLFKKGHFLEQPIDSIAYNVLLKSKK